MKTMVVLTMGEKNESLHCVFVFLSELEHCKPARVSLPCTAAMSVYPVQLPCQFTLYSCHVSVPCTAALAVWQKLVVYPYVSLTVNKTCTALRYRFLASSFCTGMF